MTNENENKEVATVDDDVLEPNALTVQDSKTNLIYADEMLKLVKVARVLHQSGMYKTLKTPAEYFAVIEYGREFGLNPMASLQNINIISGRASCNGQMMLALAKRDGVKHKVVKETIEGCTIEFVRGDESYTSTFTMEEAKKAGLTNKDNWKKYPVDMLWWRAVARGVRRISPMSIAGLQLADEIPANYMVAETTAKPIKGELDIDAMSKGKPEDHQDIRQGQDDNKEPETKENKPDEKTEPPSDNLENKPATEKSIEKIKFLLDTKSFSSPNLASMASRVQAWLVSGDRIEGDALFHIGQLESLKDLT